MEQFICVLIVSLIFLAVVIAIALFLIQMGVEDVLIDLKRKMIKDSKDKK